MDDSALYHDGNRRLQDAFDSRRIADRLEEVTLHESFNHHDVSFIERSPMFFLATADADGWPDVSYKGGLPGFVRVTGPTELAFPAYDGNGMFKSFGNILVNPKVGLLFIDFERASRLRVQGNATIDEEDALLGDFPGAMFVVRVRAERIFPNCPRYVHRMSFVEPSMYVPREGYTPPVPGWKRDPAFADALPQP